MRRWFLSLCLAVGVLLSTALPVSASHDYDVFSLYQCHTFRHVTELNDFLALCTYGAAEDTVSPPHVYGVEGGILRLIDDDAITTAQLLPLPGTGYGIAGWYLSAADNVITWGDADVQLQMEPSPTIAANPATVARAPTWHATATVAATADELADIMPQLMRQLEQLDSDIDAMEYVGVNGITEAGAAIILRAYPGLAAAAPDAFATSSAQVGDARAIPTPGAKEQSIVSEAQDSQIWNLIDGIAQTTFGIGGHVLAGFGMMVLIVAVLAGVLLMTRNMTVALGMGYLVLLWGGDMDFVPIAYIILFSLLLIVSLGVWLWQKVPSY